MGLGEILVYCHEQFGENDHDVQAQLTRMNQTAKDAIELLKAQEPRVLTLEEALGGEECWVEYSNGGCGYADCYLSYTAKGADIYRTMQHDFNVPLANYGKTWRCWTSRPTDEQMKAVKWE